MEKGTTGAGKRRMSEGRKEGERGRGGGGGRVESREPAPEEGVGDPCSPMTPPPEVREAKWTTSSLRKLRKFSYLKTRKTTTAAVDGAVLAVMSEPSTTACHFRRPHPTP